jgi:hypothetical protein
MNSHTGCFERKFFNMLSEEDGISGEPAFVSLSLDPEKIYTAELIWRKEGYKSIKLKTYYICPKKKHGYFYDDYALKECKGCFPLHWFKGFKEVDSIIEETKLFDEQTSEQIESKSLIDVMESERLEEFEQLTLF